MPGLTLVPFAVTQHWDFSEARNQPAIILAEYLQLLASECAATDNCVIGHIHGLAAFPPGKYLKIRVTAPDLPATLEGFAPPQCNRMDFTLNIQVYGSDTDVIEQITNQVAHDVAKKWQAEIR